MVTKPLTQLLQRHSLPMSGLLFFGIMAAGPIGAYATPDTSTLEEITTTATRMPHPLNQYGGNLSVLPHEHLELVSHTHINESFAQIAGGWISRGNGQEHLTALRSPVFTGAGACAEFLMAEDFIPLRAAGFCNVNQLFDANSEQAASIEVIRGPGSALYGSNAMHGVINVLSLAPAPQPETEFSLEGGPHNYSRVKFTSSQLQGDHRFRISTHATHDGGYKDDSGFDQQKLTARHDLDRGKFSIQNGLTFSNLNQETAGFIRGHKAYRDDSLKKNNPNPEAFRDAKSARAYSRWQWAGPQGVNYLVTPYLRWTDMAFLQHFLPWQSLEQNGQRSLGVQTGLYLSTWNDTLDVIMGLDFEMTQGWLEETQSQAFSATIPEGTHYDYQVDAKVVAPYAQLDWQLSDSTTLSAGLRVETTDYRYDNRTASGSACAAAITHCRFYRPADRTDTFTAASPKLSVLHQLGEQQQVYLNLSQAYRAPQATELYRLQNGQQRADLDTEQLDSVELGFRHHNESTRLALALFSMQKDQFIFQDTERQNVSDGESEHQGIEIEFSQTLTPALQANLNASYARHRYVNDTAISRQLIAGNDIDTAPRRMAQASLNWAYATKALASLEAVHLGRYFLNPENTESYDGHTLLNLRVKHQLTPHWQLGMRISNLGNIDYAERADFAFGSERYFVGEPRSVYLSIKGHFSG